MIRKIKIIAVGKIKERYLNEGINEYLKRLSPFSKVEIIELKDEGIEKEKNKIIPYLNYQSYLLDETGKEFSTLEFAELSKKNEGEFVFVIGGPEGISQELKDKNKKISLSRMTFTHEMARLFFLEQIYRAYMVNNNRQYHK